MVIPPNVVTALQNSAESDLYPVTGIQTFDGAVLKTSTLQFDSGAVLRLTRLDVPFLIIFARQILLRGPAPHATITRDMSAVAKSGKPGPGGTSGKGGARPGMAGANGTGGGAGSAGQTATMPALYIFMEKMVGHPNAPSAWLDFWLLMPGIDGGPGGTGGFGGPGGPGAIGTPGTDVGFLCGTRPGNGGNGGAGGPGSAGGAGGNGSDAGQIIFVGSDEAIAQLSWMKIVNDGGAGGQGGSGGRGGPGGPGGGAGANTPACPPAQNGYSGMNGVDGVDGQIGKDGQKGVVSVAVRVNLDQP